MHDRCIPLGHMLVASIAEMDFIGRGVDLAKSAVRDRLHLADTLRALKRAPAVLRVARVKP